MKLSTAFKISGLCLFALAAELVLAYVIFSNFAFTLADSGQYSVAEAYSTGPMGTMAKVFYGIFGLTVAVGIGAPLSSLFSSVFRKK